jgi:hypothetical protein
VKQSTYDRIVNAMQQALTDELDQMEEDGVSPEEVETARQEFLWECSDSGPRD